MKYEKTNNVRYCPICRNVGEFQDFEGREAAQCPVCKSLHRQRFQWLFLEEFLKGHPAGAKLLQFAPERCFIPHCKELFGEENYTTADIEVGGLATQVVDITDLKFADETFDYLLCSLFEQITDNRKTIDEIHRVLKKGGIAFLALPTEELQREVEKAGFALESIAVKDIVKNEFLADFLGLDPLETLFLAKK